MTTRTAFTLLILAAIAGCAPAVNESLTTDITSQELLHHVRYLASDELRGRRTGEEGNRKAAEYIAEEFKRYGIAPAGDGGGYFQPFSFLAKIREGEQNAFSMSRGTERTVFARPTQYVPLKISADTLINAPLVFAGYGLSISNDSVKYDDYAGIDVKGKIVIVLRYSPEGSKSSRFLTQTSITSKVMVAREKGAAGIIFATAPSGTDGDALSSIKPPPTAKAGMAAIAMKWEDVGTLLSAGGKRLQEIQSAIDSTQTPSSFELPGITASLQTQMIKEYGQSANIAGYVEGADPQLKGDLLVIGAHMDHLGMGGEGSLTPDTVAIHHGADDNASGTAGLLEAAQYLAANRSHLKRSVLFIAFSGEELGLLGSDYYVKHPRFPLEHTIAMLNMDMIGRMKDSILVVEGMGTAPQWESLVKAENSDSLVIRLKPDGFGPSDHASFYGKDIPVMFFFTNLHSDYHRPSDTWEKINYAGEQAVVRYVVRIAEEIANRAEKPTFTKVVVANTMSSGGDRQGVRVSLGLIPDYAEDVQGLRISGTRAGSPAEKAGLKGNDTIIRFGGKEIKSIYDFMALLEQYKPGDGVDIVVRRGNDEVKLRAILEARK